VVDESDRIVFESQLETNPAQMVRQLQRFRSVHCLVEAAPLAEWCKRELERQGIGCDLIDTRQAKGFFEARKKTDQRDARTLARMARAKWYNVVHAKSEDARLLRSRLTAREGLVGIRVGLQNQVLGLLRAHGVRVTGASGLRFATVIQERVSAQPALRALVQPLLAVWEAVCTQLRQEDRALHREARQRPEVARLCTVPGVGKLTALAFAATIDDPRRFTNASQLGDYVGLAPGVYQSGDTERLGPITRQGDRLLRSLLVEAANSVLYHYRKPWAWKDWALDLKTRKGAGKARVALARRMAGLLWHLWIQETTFQASAVPSPQAV
jgi:transposase